MLTHRNMVANLRQIHAWLAPAIGADGEMFVAALPLYHVFALQVNGFVPMMIGASNLLIANPRDIPALVKALRGARFTALPGVNTLFNALLNNEDFAKLDFSHLHLSIGGGMAVQRAIAERWQSVTGKPLIEAYGLTETSPAAIANPLNIDAFNGAIGLPMPSTEIAIRDDDGRDLKLGEAGELCIKGPQVMAGYWNRPDETEKVMTADGFLRTGDIARVDERGFVYIVDRKKDMINVSGFNVYPNEIEDVAMGHPGVLEAGAVGVPDARTGEAVKLVVVRKDASADRGRAHRLLPAASDGLQDAAPGRVPRHAAARPISARSCAANCASKSRRQDRKAWADQSNLQVYRRKDPRNENPKLVSAAVKSLRLDSLAGRCFGSKAPAKTGWISLDFLGFSRPNRAFSMGYAGFSLEEISRALSRLEAREPLARSCGLEELAMR